MARTETMNNFAPAVSVVVPCRNEKKHIERCLGSILTQKSPADGFEVIIVDGLSDDGTRSILTRLAQHHPGLRVVDNPLQTTPGAINIGIKASRGRYIAILGAHTEYARDYLIKCVELLRGHPEASCVGGPIISRGRGRFGRAVAAAMSHPVGIGNAKHRWPDYEGYAEGACYPVFRAEVFEKVGFFDEELIRNQDDEFNYRLTRDGHKVFISPLARSTYYVRETPLQLFRQYFQYGFWRVAVLRKHRLPASIRQLVPPVFMALLLVSVIVGLLFRGWWGIAGTLLPITYGVALAAVAIGMVPRMGWGTALFVPLAAMIMHVAYALGFVTGLLKRKKGRLNKMPYSKGESHASTI